MIKSVTVVGVPNALKAHRTPLRVEPGEGGGPAHTEEARIPPPVKPHFSSVTEPCNSLRNQRRCRHRIARWRAPSAAHTARPRRSVSGVPGPKTVRSYCPRALWAPALTRAPMSARTAHDLSRPPGTGGPGRAESRPDPRLHRALGSAARARRSSSWPLPPTRRARSWKAASLVVGAARRGAGVKTNWTAEKGRSRDGPE